MSAFRNRKDPFPEDTLLRLNSYRIHARPNIGEPIWEQHGEQMRHSIAVAMEKKRAEKKRLPKIVKTDPDDCSYME